MAQATKPLGLPTFAQTVALALYQVKNTLDTMDEFARHDTEWGDGETETSVDCAMTAVMHAIEWLEANPPKTLADFSERWDTVIGIVDLASRSFQREGCYKNFLQALDREVIVLNYAVDLMAAAGKAGEA